MTFIEYQDLIHNHCPQVSETDSGPEPTLSRLIYAYYANSGMSPNEAARAQDQYLRSIYRKYVKET